MQIIITIFGDYLRRVLVGTCLKGRLKTYCMSFDLISKTMEIKFAVVVSREIATFSLHSDAIHKFEDLLAKGMLGFKSDLVESITIGFVCLSPLFSRFFQAHRPKYYEDKTLKCRGSVVPEVRMYKKLTADFVVDFGTYFKLTTEEECLKFLALSFVDFLKNLKYPGKLKKFEKEKLLQAVKDIFIENSIISAYDSI